MYCRVANFVCSFSFIIKASLQKNDIFELEERLSNLNNELLKEDVYMDINKANLIKLEIDIVNGDIEKKTLEWDEITKDM